MKPWSSTWAALAPLLVACSKAGPAAAPVAAAEAAVAPAAAEAVVADAPPSLGAILAGNCDAGQAEISRRADERAGAYGIAAHLDANFPDGSVSWLMKEGAYQKYVVETGAEKFGRCDEVGCYLFAAPTAVIAAAVEGARTPEGHDASRLGVALGLPGANLEGPLRIMTLDLAAAKPCVRLPVDEDPGVWKCKTEADTDCFKFGGYTSGGIPELMVIDAPVARTVVREIP